MRYVLALPLLLGPVPAIAQPLADLAAIDRAVADFAGQAGVPVDRRLRLAACARPLALRWYGTRQDTVEIGCPAPGGWKLFVSLGGAQTAQQTGQQTGPAVMRGDAVTIIAGDGSFTVSQPGEALESAAIGAWVKVRPASGGAAPLRARVIRPGLVGIELP
ncbi:MAG: flagella basal body P-ring formation protein FlgA [Proteobacteria bacterium]|nr:flagella basal body P-ring formation protein FlgA [Pseudomonadota bacterium]